MERAERKEQRQMSKRRKGEAFRIGKGQKPKQAKAYSPPSGQGVSGVDRRKIDGVQLERDIAKGVSEVWDD
jgi:hypothetical protein